MPTYTRIREGMPAPPIRSTQVLLAALAFGVVAFTGVVAYLRFSGAFAFHSEVSNLLPFVSAGMLVSFAPLYLLLRSRAIARIGADKDAALALVREDRVPVPLHQLAIVGGALVEGAGFLAALALLLGATVYTFAIPALAALAICALIPSRSRLEELVRDARAA